MRRLLSVSVAGCLLASAAWVVSAWGAELGGGPPSPSAPTTAVKPLPQPKPVKPATKKSETCGNNGTTVNFVDTPSIAARKALKEHKLVFVLHVSGLFEDPRLT